MRLLRLAALACAGVLAAFTLRRVVLLAAASQPSRRTSSPATGQEPGGRDLPSVLALIPCRNEAATLPRLLAALDRLDYPRERLAIVVVDDGSADESAAVAGAWASGRPWASVLSLPANVGKAQALNTALGQFPLPNPADAAGGDPSNSLVVVYDADHRPAPDSLRHLAAAFDDPAVGGSSGQMRVVNGDASPAAAYAAVESLVNQFVTMQGKDRLDLAPALLGSNCAYRRTALEAVGGFTRGALLEDSDLSVALPLAGWRTRFVPESVCEHDAPHSLHGYVQQHLRWSRGFQQVAAGRLDELWRNPHLSLKLKIELTFFVMGYADRLALAAGAAFTLLDLLRPGTFGFPRALWAAYFGVPALEMVTALGLAREPRAAYARLGVVPFFFVFDLGMALWSAVAGLRRRPARWTQTERTGDAQRAR